MGTTRYDFKKQDRRPHSSAVKLLYVGHAKYDADWRSLSHVHSFAELFYVLSGSGQFRISHTYYPAAAGDLLLINANIAHTEISRAEDPMEYIVIGLSGLPSSFQLTLDEEFRLVHFDNRTDGIRNCLSVMLQEAEQKKRGYEEICHHLMEALLLQAFRQLNESADSTDWDATPHEKAAWVKEYIEKHFSEDISLDCLAAKVRVSKYYLSHIFCKHWGLSPMQYVQALRLNEGRRLLCTTDFSEKEIAAALGYSSQVYFVQRFTKVEGMSPAQYREQIQSEFTCEKQDDFPFNGNNEK